MRWRQTRRSENVQQRRGGAAAAGIGGLGLLLVLAASILFDVDPGALMQVVNTTGQGSHVEVIGTPAPGTAGDFVSQVLADTEDTWSVIFREDLGRDYPVPQLVIFEGSVQSACGLAQAAVGPFYCPVDQTVYLDLSFFDALSSRLGAEGDFAQAYVIAHEVGHHVQNVLGVLGDVQAAKARLTEDRANALSVQVELQADCFAGVWGNRAQGLRLTLDQSDLLEGLNAAQAVGDDRLQMEAQGYVVPDSFTHGTSEQRAAALTAGFESGLLDVCSGP
jgi:predicted metalloprotease